ncbi:MAG: hypothetical protein JXK05_14460 [Campylobacterales bacterium]|nr:hypothetical protein [Campylobacterales bacterium]
MIRISPIGSSLDLLWLRTGNASVEAIAQSILSHAALIYSGLSTQETGIIEIQR